MIELNKKHTLDLGSTPVVVIPIEFKDNGVLCEYVNSTPDRVELLGYELFEYNGFYKN